MPNSENEAKRNHNVMPGIDFPQFINAFPKPVATCHVKWPLSIGLFLSFPSTSSSSSPLPFIPHEDDDDDDPRQCLATEPPVEQHRGWGKLDYARTRDSPLPDLRSFPDLLAFRCCRLSSEWSNPNTCSRFKSSEKRGFAWKQYSTATTRMLMRTQVGNVYRRQRWRSTQELTAGGVLRRNFHTPSARRLMTVMAGHWRGTQSWRFRRLLSSDRQLIRPIRKLSGLVPFIHDGDQGCGGDCFLFRFWRQ